MTKLMSKEDIIISKLLIWYTKNKRILPWRIKKNTQKPVPYYIFVSEFMLQQTTVNEVTTKFNHPGSTTASPSALSHVIAASGFPWG